MAGSTLSSTMAQTMERARKLPGAQPLTGVYAIYGAQAKNPVPMCAAISGLRRVMLS